jgi:hypothetical protein
LMRNLSSRARSNDQKEEIPVMQGRTMSFKCTGSMAKD